MRRRCVVVARFAFFVAFLVLLTPHSEAQTCPAPVVVTPAVTTVNLGGQVTFQAFSCSAGVYQVLANVVWASSDPTSVTIDSTSGLAKAVNVQPLFSTNSTVTALNNQGQQVQVPVSNLHPNAIQITASVQGTEVATALIGVNKPQATLYRVTCQNDTASTSHGQLQLYDVSAQQSGTNAGKPSLPSTAYATVTLGSYSVACNSSLPMPTVLSGSGNLLYVVTPGLQSGNKADFQISVVNVGVAAPQSVASTLSGNTDGLCYPTSVAEMNGMLFVVNAGPKAFVTGQSAGPASCSSGLQVYTFSTDGTTHSTNTLDCSAFTGSGCPTLTSPVAVTGGVATGNVYVLDSDFNGTSFADDGNVQTISTQDQTGAIRTNPKVLSVTSLPFSTDGTACGGNAFNIAVGTAWTGVTGGGQNVSQTGADNLFVLTGGDDHLSGNPNGCSTGLGIQIQSNGYTTADTTVHAVDPTAMAGLAFSGHYATGGLVGGPGDGFQGNTFVYSVLGLADNSIYNIENEDGFLNVPAFLSPVPEVEATVTPNANGTVLYAGGASQLDQFTFSSGNYSSFANLSGATVGLAITQAPECVVTPPSGGTATIKCSAPYQNGGNLQGYFQTVGNNDATNSAPVLCQNTSCPSTGTYSATAPGGQSPSLFVAATNEAICNQPSPNPSDGSQVTPPCPQNDQSIFQPVPVGSPTVNITGSSSVDVPTGSAAITFNAVLQNTSDQEITWLVQGAPCGAPTNLSALGSMSCSGFAATYTPGTAANNAITLTAEYAPSGTIVASASVTINLTAPLVIQTSSLPNGTANTAYSQTLQSTGGKGTVTWSLASGALPTGLTLSGATGAISGTPTVPGAYDFTVTATDSSSPAQVVTSGSLSITINAQLTINTTSLLNGTVNSAYSQTIATTNGTAPFTWSVNSGSLPGGLTLAASTGVISGTPTTAGAFNFTVKVVDSSNPAQTVISGSLSITINAQLTINTTSLPNGVVNTAYSQTIGHTNGTAPFTWTVNSGSLPPGLTLATSTGVISGTPTTAGVSNFTVKVADSSNPVQTVISGSLSITINAQLSITTTTLASGAVNAPYSQTLTLANGTAPFTWTVNSGSLPAGLTLAPSTGVISGTPTAAGVSNFTVKVVDSSSPAQTVISGSLSITINSAISVTTAALPNGIVGTAYSQTLAVSNGTAPFTWALNSGSLPAGLTLAPSTGVISGTPTTAGSSTLTVKVTDSSTPAETATSGSLTISIAAQLAIGTTSLPNATAGAPYSTTLQATGGVTPYNWTLTAGTLPNGLTLNATTGAISGTPTMIVSNTPLTFQVKDSNAGALQQTKTANLTLTVAAPPTLQITTGGTLPNGQTGTPYSVTFAASGGVPPYTWAQTAGTLPAGLTFNTGTGAITGTPTAAVTNSPLTFRVTDSQTPTATSISANFTMTIVAPLTISTNSLPNGQVGTAYSATLQASGGLTPYTWTNTGAALPGGLSLNSATGAITGTPTTAVTNQALTFQVADTSNPPLTKTANLTLTIAPAPIQVSVVPPSVDLQAGTTQVVNFTSVVQNATTTAVTWSVAGAGCSGHACGTIDQTGKYTPPATLSALAVDTVTATSNADNKTKGTATVTIYLPPSLTNASPPPATVTAGQSAMYNLTLAGGTADPNQVLHVDCDLLDLPTGVSCPQVAVTPAAQAVNFALVVQTTARTATSTVISIRMIPTGLLAAGALVALALLFVFPQGEARRRKLVVSFAGLLLLVGWTMSIAGCATNGTFGTPPPKNFSGTLPGSYTIHVRATVGAAAPQDIGTLTLNVN